MSNLAQGPFGWRPHPRATLPSASDDQRDLVSSFVEDVALTTTSDSEDAGIERTFVTPSTQVQVDSPSIRRSRVTDRSNHLAPFTLLKRDRWLQLIIGMIVVAFLVTSLTHPQAGGTDPLWLGGFYLIASTLPVVPMVLQSRRTLRLRTPWRCMAAVVVTNAIAFAISVLHDQTMTTFSFPSPSEVAYLVSGAIFVVAVALLTQVKLVTVPMSVRLDGAVVGLTAAAIVGMWRFLPLLHLTGHSLQAIVAFTYPLCDLLLLALVVAGLAPHSFRPTWTTSLLMAGVLCWIGGDALFLNQSAVPVYSIQSEHQAIWLVGIWLIGLSASARNRQGTTVAHEPSGSSVALSLLPVIAGLLSTLVVAITWRRGINAPAVPIMAFGAILFVIARMWVSLREENSLITSSKSDARTDALTGLPNRRSILESIESQLESLTVKPTGLILIDLDGFKEVNDTLGHLAGDELLCLVGLRFQSKLTGRGVFGRLGGDEFAFVAPTSSESELTAIARELIGTLSEPLVLDGVSVHVGASMGVAVSTPDGVTAVEIIRGADVAMYESKRTKCGVSVYRTKNDPNSREQLELLSDLRKAIDSRGLTVHYQPTLDMRTKQVRGVEALARWRHPQLGMVYPETFIPMTERAGLMPELTRAVLVQSVAQASRLDQLGHRLQMSVNISRYDLLDGELPNFIQRILSFHSFPASRLTIEITESALGTDHDRASECVRNLRKRGIRVSIDDYGVGYSSMSQLLELDIDEIKIDKSFVQGLCSDSRAEAIIRSAVELSRALGVSLVTEGIETEDVLETLRAIGADIGQGFFIARPFAPHDLEAFLAYPESESGLRAEFALIAGVD
jgi:diguanylate cyclase (GGDEF)-like protein